jgi:hypothetical protein
VITDVEISRALNALSTTMRDQRPQSFEVARVEEIVTGALAGEAKLSARRGSATSGELRIRGEDRLVAVVTLIDGQWTVERKLRAGESSWALPQPAHDRQQASANGAGG